MNFSPIFYTHILSFHKDTTRDQYVSSEGGIMDNEGKYVKFSSYSRHVVQCLPGIRNEVGSPDRGITVDCREEESVNWTQMSSALSLVPSLNWWLDRRASASTPPKWEWQVSCVPQGGSASLLTTRAAGLHGTEGTRVAVTSDIMWKVT